MRTMLTIEMDVQAGNQAIMDGALPKTIQTLISEIKPESSYFFAHEGKRTAQFIFDMKDSSQIPKMVEPFFINLKAKVYLQPVMNLEELKKGLDSFNESFKAMKPSASKEAKREPELV